MDSKRTSEHSRVLAAEGAVILRVLGHLHLLDHLSQRSAITGTVLAADPDLLGVLSHGSLQYNVVTDPWLGLPIARSAAAEASGEASCGGQSSPRTA